MIILLSSCMDGREQVEKRRTELISRQECSYLAKMRLHVGEQIRDYILQVTHNGDQTGLTVVEPEDMAGLSATVTGKQMTLTYDDIVFAGERLEGGMPSPLLCFPVFWEAMQNGALTLATEIREGLEAELICYYENTEYTLKVWFEGEETLPHRIEVVYNGKILAEIETVGEASLPGLTFES